MSEQDPIELARRCLDGRGDDADTISTLARAVLALAAERDELRQTWHCNDCGESEQRTMRRVSDATNDLTAQLATLRAALIRACDLAGDGYAPEHTDVHDRIAALRALATGDGKP